MPCLPPLTYVNHHKTQLLAFLFCFSKLLPNLMHIYYSKRTSGPSKISFNDTHFRLNLKIQID